MISQIKVCSKTFITSLVTIDTYIYEINKDLRQEYIFTFNKISTEFTLHKLIPETSVIQRAASVVQQAASDVQRAASVVQ